jgi:adenosylmethionine---8-amino-7-oxononanoate aminotransferase
LQGASGMRMYSPAILGEMIEYAQQKNIVCIADEVLTGFGRTGKNFASEYLSHKPDIMALSKGLTGGTMPLGVTTCSEKILSPFMGEGLLDTFFHGHSYTANPLACAAANASFALLMDPSCQGNIHRISGKHQDFKIKLRQHGKLSDIRCLGTVLALELKTKEVSSYANEARKKIYDFFLERNILLRPLGNVIYVLPPYIISDQELDSVYAAIETFLDGY